jgi:tetratricopeptide (TPR) repeat protein
MTVLEDLMVRLLGDAGSYQQMLADVIKGTTDASASIQNMGNDIEGIQKHVQSFGSTAVDFITQVGLSLSGIGLAVGAVRKAAGAEDLRTDFEVLLGSANAAERMIGKLEKMSEVTPFRKETLVQSTRQLLGMNMAAQDILPNLKLLGDISGGSTERLGTLTSVLGRTSSEGIFASYNMKLLRSTGFNPLKELAEATGKSVTYWTGEMHKGNITMDLLRQAMEHATAEGGRFHDSMARKSQTLTGIFTTLLDAVSKPLKLLGETIVEALDLKQVERNIIESTRNVKEFFTSLPPEVKKLGTALIEMTATTIALAGGWKVVTVVWAAAASVIIRIDQVLGAVVNGLVAGFQVLNSMTAASSIIMMMLGGEVALLVVGFLALVAIGREAGTWLIGQKEAQQELNEEIARGAHLNDLWSKTFARRTANVLEEAGHLSGKDKESFLIEQLALANKELEGQQHAAKAAKVAFDEYDNAIRRGIGQAQLKMLKEAWEEANKHVAAGRDRIEAIEEALGKFNKEQDKEPKGLTDMMKHLEISAKTAGMSKEAAEVYKKELDKLPASQATVLWHQIALTRASEELAAKHKELQQGVKSLSKSLDDQAEAIGLTSEQAKLHKLELEGLGAVDRILLEGKVEINRWLKKQNELFKEGADTIKQTRTPLEAYSDQIDKLQKMLAVGAITPNVFARALQEARKHFDAARESAAGARQEIQKLEGVLAGSAEAASHIIDYTVNVLGPSRGGPDLAGKGISMGEALTNLPGPLPAPLPTREPETLVPPPQAVNDKVISVLGTIADRLLELVRKPTLPVVPAGLR